MMAAASGLMDTTLKIFHGITNLKFGEAHGKQFCHFGGLHQMEECEFQDI